jgi:hypothetical protein
MLVPSLRLAQLATQREPARRALPPRSTSLVPSCRTSSPLSAVGRALLKQSGLHSSLLSSATQNLAYLPCRIARDGSIFRFFVGGDVCKKKASRLQRPQHSVFLTTFGASLRPPSQTSHQGALLCGLKTITERQMCFGLTLVSFTPRHHNEPRTDSVVLRPQFERRSSPVLPGEHNQEWCAQSSCCPVAARRAAFFRPRRAVKGSARITAASPWSPFVSSPSNRRFCFSPKPNSACRTPSLTMSASGIGIGWRPNA